MGLFSVVRDHPFHHRQANISGPWPIINDSPQSPKCLPGDNINFFPTYLENHYSRIYDLVEFYLLLSQTRFITSCQNRKHLKLNTNVFANLTSIFSFRDNLPSVGMNDYLRDKTGILKCSSNFSDRKFASRSFQVASCHLVYLQSRTYEGQKVVFCTFKPK